MSETGLPQVVIYKGVPATELSREELLEALQVAMESLEQLRKNMAQDREMQAFFDRNGLLRKEEKWTGTSVL